MQFGLGLVLLHRGFRAAGYGKLCISYTLQETAQHGSHGSALPFSVRSRKTWHSTIVCNKMQMTPQQKYYASVERKTMGKTSSNVQHVQHIVFLSKTHLTPARGNLH